MQASNNKSLGKLIDFILSDNDPIIIDKLELEAVAKDIDKQVTLTQKIELTEQDQIKCASQYKSYVIINDFIKGF